MKTHAFLSMAFGVSLFFGNEKPLKEAPVFQGEAAQISSRGKTVVVRPVISEMAIVNPGKGWVAYGKAENQPKEVLEMVSLGYSRFQWGDIEPEEGVYHWEIIDNAIKSWSDAGKQFAFGVMCASSHSRNFWVTPKWVFDAGARYDTFELKSTKLSTEGIPGPKLVPVFDDPVFLKKLEIFIKALAARYDGNPNIAFIDIRSYGNWGEGHMYPFGKPDISAGKFKEHILIHRNAFKKSLLQLPTGKHKEFIPVQEWAVSIGVGLRRDGICGNSDGSEVSICAGKMPAVFEFYGNYEMMKSLGWWDGKKDKEGRGYRLADCVETGKPTYCDLSRGGESGLKLLKEDPSLVNKLTNRLGYHMVINEAKYPGKIKSDAPARISVTWINRGIANIFIPVKVSFALIPNDGRVMEVCDGIASKPALWNPEVPETVEEIIQFTNTPAGEYSLAVGILQPGDSVKPSIKLGNELKTIDGWYVLGPVTITDNKKSKNN
jgi:hypothetical protein